MLPLKDNVPTRSFPVVTVALIAINAAVWLFYQLPDLDRSVHDLAFHPCEVNGSCAQIDKGWWIAAVTSMFMHASWLHILGNMLFLFIFGNNVEDVMGRIRFVVFYIAGGFAAALTQTLATLEWSGTAAASVPNVGASGAIAAVLGAYFVLLPRARIVTLLFGFLPWRLSAGFFLGVWFLFQLWQSNFSITHPGQGGGVAFAAHVGGFVFGAVTVKAFQVRPPLEPRQRRRRAA